MNSTYCSPNNEHNSVSCFNNDSLLDIAAKYNEYYDDKVAIPVTLDDNTKQILWQNILDKVNSRTQCNYEYCWLKQDFLKNKLDNTILNNFRPEMPSNWANDRTKWLSTLDIQAVLKQYDDKYDDFKFIGAVPIDFDYEIFTGFCVVNELCKINLKQLYKKGIRKLGIVFNFDPHNKPGSHWVAMYSDFDNGGIYYFDSYGKSPINQIDKLMEKIRIQGNNLIYKKIIDFGQMGNKHVVKAKVINVQNKKLLVDKNMILYTPFMVNNSKKIYTILGGNIGGYLINKALSSKNPKFLVQKGFRKFYSSKRYQYKFSECGMYSIFFIHSMLSGKSYKNTLKLMKSDDEINRLRNNYFISEII